MFLPVVQAFQFCSNTEQTVFGHTHDPSESMEHVASYKFVKKTEQAAAEERLFDL